MKLIPFGQFGYCPETSTLYPLAEKGVGISVTKADAITAHQIVIVQKQFYQDGSQFHCPWYWNHFGNWHPEKGAQKPNYMDQGLGGWCGGYAQRLNKHLPSEVEIIDEKGNQIAGDFLLLISLNFRAGSNPTIGVHGGGSEIFRHVVRGGIYDCYNLAFSYHESDKVYQIVNGVETELPISLL